jgi:hypothetical protein
MSFAHCLLQHRLVQVVAPSVPMKLRIAVPSTRGMLLRQPGRPQEGLTGVKSNPWKPANPRRRRKRPLRSFTEVHAGWLEQAIRMEPLEVSLAQFIGAALGSLSTAPRMCVTRKLAHPRGMRLGRLHALPNPDSN